MYVIVEIFSIFPNCKDEYMCNFLRPDCLEQIIPKQREASEWLGRDGGEIFGVAVMVSFDGLYLTEKDPIDHDFDVILY